MWNRTHFELRKIHSFFVARIEFVLLNGEFERIDPILLTPNKIILPLKFVAKSKIENHISIRCNELAQPLAIGAKYQS